MISPRKREREKNRREKRETKEAELARLGQARQENQSAVWPPEAAGTERWPQARSQAIVDDLVALLGTIAAPKLRSCVRRIASNPEDLQAYRLMGDDLFTEGELEPSLKVFEVVV